MRSYVGVTTTGATPTGALAADLPALRRRLRAQRRAVGPGERRVAGRALARQLARVRYLRGARRIAGYWPADGEIDIRPALERALAAGSQVYLPRLVQAPRPRLCFAPWRPGARMEPNRYGIAEPVAPAGAVLTARQLDVIVLPLVGFDAAGNRLGMGGGWYDRSLAFRRRSRSAAASRPRLLGVAYELQRLDRLAPRAWDVPVDLIVTDQRVYAPVPPEP